MKLFPFVKNARTTKPPILVVDDDPNIRRVLVRVLRKQGFEVIDTDRGTNVVALCLEHRPQVVFLDLIMPGIDGAQVVRMLHSSLLGRVPSIVMVTGTYLPGNVKEALGIDDYLPKPFELDRVVSLAEKYSTPPPSASLA
jgi:CheY-like chemotaxis protein